MDVTASMRSRVPDDCRLPPPALGLLGALVGRVLFVPTRRMPRRRSVRPARSASRASARRSCRMGQSALVVSVTVASVASRPAAASSAAMMAAEDRAARAPPARSAIPTRSALSGARVLMPSVTGLCRASAVQVSAVAPGTRGPVPAVARRAASHRPPARPPATAVAAIVKTWQSSASDAARPVAPAGLRHPAGPRSPGVGAAQGQACRQDSATSFSSEGLGGDAAPRRPDQQFTCEADSRSDDAPQRRWRGRASLQVQGHGASRSLRDTLPNHSYPHWRRCLSQ
jgi:hypothetical protein